MEVPNSMNPVVYSPVKTREISSDPFVREAYFGSPDTPGIISQAIDAANRVYLLETLLVLLDKLLICSLIHQR